MNGSQSGSILLKKHDNEFLPLTSSLPISGYELSRGAQVIFTSDVRVTGRRMPSTRRKPPRTEILACCSDVWHLSSGATSAAFASRNRYGSAILYNRESKRTDHRPKNAHEAEVRLPSLGIFGAAPIWGHASISVSGCSRHFPAQPRADFLVPH